MCGIAGVVNYRNRAPVRPEALARMCTALHHRGPDAQGEFVRPQQGVGFAHTRLSILDLAGGDQPIPNEDGTINVVFNGEIYNYKELRDDLLSRGHKFRTNTDTEVLVHLYEERGEKMLDALLGDFAFAIWDDRTNSLLLARDRLGVKPLYYSDHAGRLVFGSTLPSLLAAADIPREIDPDAVYCYLMFGCIQAPQSIYRHVRKLLPGHFLTVRGGQVRIEKYWDFELRPDESRTIDSYAEELDALISDAVRRQMMADVPVGAFLSGGVDSSTVVSRMLEVAGGRVKTFSVGFRESAYDESRFYKLLAEEMGIEHHEVVLEPSMLTDVDSIALAFGEPCSTTSAFALHYLSRVARQHVKVVLSGDGPDEVFAGYERYYFYLSHMVRASRMLPRVAWKALFQPLILTRPLSVERRIGNMARRLRKFVGTLSLPREQWHPFMRVDRTLQTHPISLVHPRVHAALSSELPYVGQYRRGLDPRGRDWMQPFIYADIKTCLPDEMFTKLDCMTMANSLEGRVPLSDHRIVELAARIPSHMKYSNGLGKIVMRKAVGARLPRAIMHRPKVGFLVPLDQWYRGPLLPMARELLNDRGFRESELFNQSLVLHLLDSHVRRRDNFGKTIWMLIVFELWRRSIGSAVPTVAAAAATPPRPQAVGV